MSDKPPELTNGAAEEVTAKTPRLRSPNRKQLLLRPVDLEATIPEDHEARHVWRLVEKMDLSKFVAGIEAREGAPGRNATDPKLLIALWLYATTQAVGSARELARLCEAHDAYRWLCGGVTLNHHTLSDFRVGHGKALDELFTQMLAVMMKAGLVTVTRVAQDGTRIRASAGASSFRREPRLRAFLRAAEKQVAHVKKLSDDPTATAREAAARQRAAREREERIQEALEELPKAREAKGKDEKAKARASTTDPEARVMKMGDGGFRPAFNVQLATTTAETVIVGVSVTNIGSDKAQLAPMLEQIEERTGQRPDEYLADTGYVDLQVIEDAEKKGTKVYAPPSQKKGAEPSFEPKPGDSPEVVAWRARMGTLRAKDIYKKQRGATAELVNAELKERQGLKLRVRGLDKVLIIALWHALAYNLMRWASLTT
jgi:transposase